MLEYLRSAGLLPVRNFPGLKSSWIQRADVMDVAAASGHLGAVQWLNKNQPEGCTTSAMDGAAANGHLEVVKWLHANRPEGCTTRAMDDAASSGHLAVVQWLQANRSEGFTERAVFVASSEDHTEVVKLLSPQCSKKSKEVAMDHAISNGNLALVQWLCTQAKVDCTAKSLIRAAKHGELEILKYLSWNRPISDESSAMVMQEALAHGHTRVAYWWLHHFVAVTPMPIHVSSCTGFESLLFAHFYYPEMFTRAYLAEIREKPGCLFIKKWIDAQISQLRPYIDSDV